MGRESGGLGISTGTKAESDAIGVAGRQTPSRDGGASGEAGHSLGGDAPVDGVGTDSLTLLDGGLDGAEGTGVSARSDARAPHLPRTLQRGLRGEIGTGSEGDHGAEPR